LSSIHSTSKTERQKERGKIVGARKDGREKLI
jgi:hypothetical protein